MGLFLSYLNSEIGVLRRSLIHIRIWIILRYHSHCMEEHFSLNQHVQQLEIDLDIVLRSSHNDQKISSFRLVEVSIDVVQRL